MGHWMINKNAHVLVVYFLKVIYLIRRELLFVTVSGSPEPSDSNIQLACAFLFLNIITIIKYKNYGRKCKK